MIYSNSYKIAKKWLQNCRGGVVNSKDAGLRPLCERNATMKRGRGQTLGYFSPCGKEERKISDISRRTLVIGANLLVAELRPDAAPDMVSKCRVEKNESRPKAICVVFLVGNPVNARLCIVVLYRYAARYCHTAVSGHQVHNRHISCRHTPCYISYLRICKFAYSLPSELAGSAYIAATTYSSSRRSSRSSRSSGGSSNIGMGRRGPVRMTV